MSARRMTGLRFVLVASAACLISISSIAATTVPQSSYLGGIVRADRNGSAELDPDAPMLKNLSPPIFVGEASSSIVIDQPAGEAFVANFWSDNVTVISTVTHTRIASFPTGATPTELLTDPQDGMVFALANPIPPGNVACVEPECPGNGTLTAYSTAENRSVGALSVGSDPYGFALSAHSDEVLVANLFSQNVSVVSPRPFGPKASLAVPLSYDVGLAPPSYALIADPTNSLVYSFEPGPPGLGVDENPSNVTIINATTNTITGEIHVAGSPYMGVFDPWNKILYVGDGNRTVSWVDVISTVTNQLLTTIGLLGEPYQMVVDPVNGNLLVATELDLFDDQFYAGNLTLISGTTNSVIKNIVWPPLFNSLVAPWNFCPVVFDNVTRAAYILRQGNLTVFNATTMTPLYSDSSGGLLMAVDSADNTLYIVNPVFAGKVPGSVDIFAAPWPIPPPTGSSVSSLAWGLGWMNLAALVALGSAVAALMIGVVVWYRFRRRKP